MKQKILTNALMVLLAVVLLATGCKAESQAERTDLKLLLTSEQFSSERSLIPDSQKMVITDYHLSGNGPKGQTFEVDSPEQAIAIGNLMIGRWTIEAIGYNAEGIPLVSGTITTLLSKVTSTATLYLTDLVGTGTLETLVTWDPNQVADDVSLQVVLLDQQGNAVDLSIPVLDTSKGEVRLESPLASGSYLLQLRLFSQDLLVSGATEAIRILSDTTSSGTVHMVIGDLSTNFMMTITNDTMLPIEGTITASPASPAAGDQVTLSYTPTNLPESISLNDLEIDWYCEGSIAQEQNSTYISIPEAGTHRYDVVVRHEKMGSLGNTTLLVTMPYQN